MDTPEHTEENVGSKRKNNSITEVGSHEWQWVPEHKLKGLRRFVDVSLAKEGLNHTQAADRAKVSKSHWSNVVNADRITKTELEVIARGLKLKPTQLISELATE